MSEHYDFHYQPTGSGAISGQQVLQQTEDAINELGDYVNDNVGGAMDVAQQALETAQNAEQDAQTALDTANSFSSAIQSAQQDASTALSTAQTAQTTASNANNTAIQAQQDASSAVTTANNASGQVSTLSGTVTALGQRVTTAEGNIGQNTSDITALTTRVGTAEGNITTLQNDVTIAQGNASSAMATAGTVKQQAFVFRYSSTALTASSTNSNTLLDNTDNLKVGDKVIDSSGVLFSITAIDTANSTFTIGTALIDLALDANVVHTDEINSSGIGIIEGVKEVGGVDFNTLTTQGLYGANASGSTNNPVASPCVVQVIRRLNSVIQIANVSSSAYKSRYIRYCADITAQSPVWQSWIKLATDDEVVHKSGDETVAGFKDFANIRATNSIKGINLENTTTDLNNCYSAFAPSDESRGGNIQYYYCNTVSGISNISNLPEASAFFLTSITTRLLSNALYVKQILISSSSKTFVRYCHSYTWSTWVNETDSEYVHKSGSETISGNKTFSSINGVEPSSLSLPSGNANDVIDISSYITALDGTSNSYTVPANGWISIAVVGTAIDIVSSSWSDSRLRASSGNVRMLYPVLKNETLDISVTGTTLAYARFIPCQGNV